MQEKVQKSPEKSVTPSESMALQTYEFFNGGEDRGACLDAFMGGESVGLRLDYPGLESSAIDEHVSNLNSLAFSDETISATPEYRLAEATFLQASRRINDRVRPVGQSEIDQFQEINEAIYGRPDRQTTQQMLGRIWSQLEERRSPATTQVLSEIEEGFVFTAADGGSVSVPGLPKPEGGVREALPTLSDEALSYFQDKLRTEMAPVESRFQEYAETVISARQNGDTAIYPEDIAAMFRDSIDALGYTGVFVIVDEDATALSWSSARQAVIVGGKRKPLKSVEDAIGVFMHEVGVHGRRYASGQELGDESLANGLFTEADDGESPDYLTFEEGLAGTLQKVIKGEKESWGIASMALYMNVALAHEGWSPRQIQEVMSRIRTVLLTKDDAETVTEETMQKAQRAAASSVTRVFRGTPSDDAYRTSDGVTLHYAKDLAYAAGKVKVIPLLNAIVELPEHERQAEFDKLFYGKYDPTNHRQREYVETVVRDRIKA